ncbi:hypothetical protein OIU79_016253 [Salix purpurea]|uniref:Uncharacterized protein n=1 Tax=Salix purpurea TaxID=77065 RepID=A0A9Q0SRG6_SALPP|nr:hypothetical protein OIU79_016253 [Salix purpurea]
MHAVLASLQYFLRKNHDRGCPCAIHANLQKKQGKSDHNWFFAMALGLVFLCITALLFKIAGIIGHLFSYVFVQWLQLKKKHPQARYVGCLVQLICSTTGTAAVEILVYDGTRIYSCIEQPRSEDEETDAFDYCSVYDGKFFPSTVSQISCGISSYGVYNPDVISKEPVCNRGSAWLS